MESERLSDVFPVMRGVQRSTGITMEFLIFRCRVRVFCRLADAGGTPLAPACWGAFELDLWGSTVRPRRPTWQDLDKIHSKKCDGQCQRNERLKDYNIGIPVGPARILPTLETTNRCPKQFGCKRNLDHRRGGIHSSDSSTPDGVALSSWRCLRCLQQSISRPRNLLRHIG